MSFPRFHPAVRNWFTSSLGQPTSAQLQGWESIGRGQHTLIAAPTGSGKTLAAFLTAIDELIKEGSEQPLPDEVRVLYVSPLKALSADIHKNLAEPRRAIRVAAENAGLSAPRITAAVRTGDTTASERAAMLRTPPHILVTTPESLYLLLTAERSRRDAAHSPNRDRGRDSRRHRDTAWRSPVALARTPAADRRATHPATGLVRYSEADRRGCAIPAGHPMVTGNLHYRQ